MSLSNKESNIYDELTELSDENSELRETIASLEYEILGLSGTVDSLKHDAIRTYVQYELIVKRLEIRRLH